MGPRESAEAVAGVGGSRQGRSPTNRPPDKLLMRRVLPRCSAKDHWCDGGFGSRRCSKSFRPPLVDVQVNASQAEAIRTI